MVASSIRQVTGQMHTQPSVICESCGHAVVSEQVSYDSKRLKIVCTHCRGEHRQEREKQD
jgi:formylmethanofuran dehydrogenase subunit E